MTARARPKDDALCGHRQARGVKPRQPGWRRGGGRRQIHTHAVGIEQIDHLVEPGEVVLTWSRLDPRPGEHAERDQIDAGRPHHPGVLLPDCFGPLLGVVVAAVDEVRKGWESGMCRRFFSRSRHSRFTLHRTVPLIVPKRYFNPVVTTPG